MAVQDLTPQLRTRMGRVERAVGVFVSLAAILLFAGFGYYLYNTGQRKGWFVEKVKYFTFVDSGAGLNVGDPVKLMGFNAGEITGIIPQPPGSSYKIFVSFVVRDPYFGYVWDDSKVKITAGDFLGKRYLEIVEGGTSQRTNLHASYLFEKGEIKGVWDDKAGAYVAYPPESKGYYVTPEEAPALMGRLETLAGQLEKALPDFLHLTNQLTRIMTNTMEVTSNANVAITAALPLVSDVAKIVSTLKEPKGSLGEWIIPTNLNAQLQLTLTSADRTLGTANEILISANTNLTAVALRLDQSLENLANLTSNLNAQAQANTNILSNISSIITHSDEMVQGLKRHWFLRSAFKTNQPSKKSVPKAGKR
jgi:ABC-type transporter Mla subunit MlaD